LLDEVGEDLAIAAQGHPIYPVAVHQVDQAWLRRVPPAHVMSQGHRVKPGSKRILTLRVTGSQGHDLYIGRDPVNLNLTNGEPEMNLNPTTKVGINTRRRA
jgi:hypothetical protein